MFSWILIQGKPLNPLIRIRERLHILNNNPVETQNSLYFGVSCQKYRDPTGSNLSSLNYKVLHGVALDYPGKSVLSRPVNRIHNCTMYLSN